MKQMAKFKIQNSKGKRQKVKGKWQNSNSIMQLALSYKLIQYQNSNQTAN